MMEFVPFAVAVLSLLSVGHSAPVTNCDSLTQPLEIQRDQLLGKWIYLAESTDFTGSQLLTNMFVESTWAKITAANESDGINMFYLQKMFGHCFKLSTDFTVVNNTVSAVRPYEISGTLLQTGCPDCLVFSAKYAFGGSTYNGLELLSRRNKVTAAELDEFMKQVECLNLPTPAILDPEKGLCSDVSSSQESDTTDLTNITNVMGSEIFNTFNRIVNSEGGLQTFIEMVTSNVAGLKSN